MPMLVRKNPETPCQPAGAHHPHWMECDDPFDCGCFEDLGEPFSLLTCCVCGQEWPCATKQERSRV